MLSRSPQPGAPTRQAEMSAESRQRISEAAASLFAEQGYAKTSLKDIEARAGISRGSILHHFGSKERLLLTVVEGTFRDWVATTLERIDDRAGLTAIRAVQESHRLFVNDNPDANRRFYILAGEALAGRDELAARYTDFLDELLEIARSLIRDGIKAGDIRRDIDADSLARTLCGVYLGICLLLPFGTPTDLDKLYADLARLVESAFSRPPTAAERRRP
jgi:AcrR family transcriptional regulator